MVVLAISICHPAAAVSGDDDQAAILESFVLSRDVQTYVGSLIQQMEPEPLKAQCGTLRVLDANRYVIVVPPVFVKEGNGYALQSGAVAIQATVDRCGQRVIRRVLLMRKNPSERVAGARLTPGDFGGNAILERDTILEARPLAYVTAKCSPSDPVYPIDTKSVTRLGPDGGEVLWTFWACSKPVQIDVHYTPMLSNGARAGMNIVAGPVKLLDRLP